MTAWLADFHFLRPIWLLALALLPLLVWQRRRIARRADPWRHVCDPGLLAHLRHAPATQNRASLDAWAMGIALVLLILALAGPAFRQAPQAVMRLHAPLVVAVDLSERMRATDLKPDRMSRVRFKLADLLSRRSEGQTALIGYAGESFTVAPLTDDAASLESLAAALAPDVMPVQGQRADRAIERALRLLRDAGETDGDLLLMTDHVDGRASNAARAAREAGLRVSVLGVGTPQGAPVPRSRGGFLEDEGGAILIPRLDARGLEQLARLGGGRYVPMSLDDSDLQELALDASPAHARVDADARGREILAWRDEGPWLLLALLPLAALAFRRGALAMLALALLLPTAPAQALDWDALWKRPDQRAWEALQQGDAERARTLAKDPALAGAAAYRAESYPDAIEAYSQGNDATASYNLGNALAKAQRYQDAIAAYDRALAQQPDFPDAVANRKAVEDWLRQQQSEGSDQDSSGEGAGEGQSSEGANGKKSPSEGAQEQGEAQPQDGQSPQDAADQERQGAQDSAQEPSKGDENQGAEGEKNQREDGSDADAGEGNDAQRYAEEMQEALEQSQSGEAQGEREAPVAPVSAEESERQQAMEHLLQRVPDDPGGLLRRKFQLELQRRQREGRNP